MNKIKILQIVSVGIITFFVMTPAAFAHVVVKPNQVSVAAFQTFTVGVPNEKDNPVTSLRLVIPEGLEHVTPNVKQGWTVEVKKEKVYEGMKGEKLNNGKEAPYTEKITEIIWTGGSIPEGQRDDFLFSAQAPADETTVQWKAYQTYENGDIVSWDQGEMKHSDNEMEKMEEENHGPYSETKVINDLKASAAEEETTALKDKVNKLTWVSEIALALAAAAIALSLRKKK